MTNKLYSLPHSFWLVHFYCANHLIGGTHFWELTNMIIYPIDIDFIMSLQVEHIIVHHSIHAFDLFVKVIFLFKTTRGLVVPRGC